MSDPTELNPSPAASEAPAPALDELLVEAPATLPGASEVAAAAPQASAAVVAAVIAPNATPALDELLRQQPLL